MQFDKIYEILMRGVAAPPVQIVHKGRPPGGAQHTGVTTKLNIIDRIARVLGELSRGRRPDRLSAKTRRESDTCAINIAARTREDSQDLGVVLKLHPGFGQNDIGILFDLLQPGLAEHIEGRKLALNERRAHF